MTSATSSDFTAARLCLVVNMLSDEMQIPDEIIIRDFIVSACPPGVDFNSGIVGNSILMSLVGLIFCTIKLYLYP